MRGHTLATVVLVVAVGLAGCSAVDRSAAGDRTETGARTVSPSETLTAAPVPTDSPTPTATSTPSRTPTATPTRTPEPWTEPEPPNRPVEDKTGAEPSRRITAVEVVDGVEAEDGAGYANFDLEVHANTSMPSVDPASHGTVEGEPYFLVYAEGELIERSKRVLPKADGTYTLEINPGGLDRVGTGEVDLTVKLMDLDSEYDDVYGVRNVTVTYSG